MPVLSVLSLQCRKGPKMKLLRKFPKKLPKIFYTRRATEPEDEVQGRPTASRRPLGAAWGDPCQHPAWTPWAPPRTPPWPIFLLVTEKPEISSHFFQKRFRSPPPSKPSFGGHQDPALAPWRRGPWPRGHLHQLFFTP